MSQFKRIKLTRLKDTNERVSLTSTTRFIGADSGGNVSGGDGTRALLSIERNIANIERSILNSSQHGKHEEIYDSDAHHQVKRHIYCFSCFITK